ncbi:MAG: RNA 3'-terminal phosphate cyclase [Candidatus Riflebacteria bacterium]
MIILDGSFGEGGGQILRTALALSACTGQPFRIHKIRSGRKKAGLLRQHLTCVNAISEICEASTTGAEIGSDRLEFTPGEVKPGSYNFSVGTAGSSMLVLQTVLPPLLLTGKTSTVELQGGTHNPMSPTFHYIDEVFLPLIRRHYAECEARLDKWGFFPAGGGKSVFKIDSIRDKEYQLNLVEEGSFIAARAIAATAKISREIAEDEAKAMVNACRFPVNESQTLSAPSSGPGNVAWLRLDFENCSAMFTGFGELGVSRQKVAMSACKPANEFFAAKCPVDEHLADQIIVIMALCGGGTIRTTRPTLHTKTNLHILEQFLPVTTNVEPDRQNSWKIEIRRTTKGD